MTSAGAKADATMGPTIQKLARIPKAYRISKRPLSHPPIPPPYTSDQKVVYISTKTPFMSAVSRVRALLKKARARSTQSLMAEAERRTHKGRTGDKILAAALAEVEKREAGAARLGQARGGLDGEVVVKGTGRAIEKVLGLAAFFEGSKVDDVKVRLGTGSVWAIDDILEKNEEELQRDEELERDGGTGGDSMEGVEEENTGDEDVPDARMRQTSVLEVYISSR